MQTSKPLVGNGLRSNKGGVPTMYWLAAGDVGWDGILVTGVAKIGLLVTRALCALLLSNIPTDRQLRRLRRALHARSRTSPGEACNMR